VKQFTVYGAVAKFSSMLELGDESLQDLKSLNLKLPLELFITFPHSSRLLLKLLLIFLLVCIGDEHQRGINEASAVEISGRWNHTKNVSNVFR
jgi:hypothetical protein